MIRLVSDSTNNLTQPELVKEVRGRVERPGKVDCSSEPGLYFIVYTSVTFICKGWGAVREQYVCIYNLH